MINFNKHYFKLMVLILLLVIVPTYCIASEDVNLDCSITIAEQDTVYVSLEGDNDNDGTFDSPKLTLDGEKGAIAYANNKNITNIVLGNGTFTVEGIEINEDNFKLDKLTFSGSGNTVISAGGDYNIFTIGIQDINSRVLNITFNNINFTNSDYYFPAISAFHSYLIINNCNFYNNRGQSSSCVGSYYNSTARISNSKFFNNGGNEGNGAVENSAGGYFDKNNIIDNYMYIENCQFFNNSADYGGAITNYDDTSINAIMVIRYSNFTDNSASEGGAIFNNAGNIMDMKGSSELYVEGCYFKGNTAKSAGGAIYVGGNSEAFLIDSIFEKNAVSGQLDISNEGVGGAIFAGAGSARIYYCQFNFNNATRGGAIFNTASNDIIIEDSNFTSNNATIGGAVYMDLPNDYGQYSKFNNLSFVSNVAEIGDSIFTNDLNMEGSQYLFFNCSNSLFEDNSLYNVGNLGLYGNYFNNSDIFNTGTILTNNNKFANSTFNNSTAEMNFRFLNNLSGYFGDIVKIRANVTNVFSQNVIVFVVGLKEYLAVFNETSGLYEYDYKINTGNDVLVHGYSLLDNEVNSNTITISLLKLPVNLTVNVDDMFAGYDLRISVDLSANNTLLSASISVIIEGKTYNVYVKDGHGENIFKNVNLPVGVFEAKASYGKNSFIYEYTNVTTTFAVIPFNITTISDLNGSVIDISNKSGYFKESVVLSANLTKDGQNAFYLKPFYFNINNQLIEAYYNVASNQYEATYVISNNESCDISINDSDAAIVNKGVLTLLKHSINLSVEIPDIIFNKTFLFVYVNATSDGIGVDGVVKVTIDNQTYDIDITDGKGLDIIHNIDVGNYTAFAQFEESDYYYGANTTIDFEVIADLKYTSLKTESIELYYKNGTRFVAYLLDFYDKPIANQTIVFYINGVANERVTNSEGRASIAINLNPDLYVISTEYNGTDKYDPVTVTNTVNVLPTISGEDIVKIFRNDTQYHTKFLDKNGNPLVGQKVKFNINGVWYDRTTDNQGMTTVKINLNPGKYVVTAVNSLNGEEYSNNITVLSSIEGNNLIKYFQNSSQYQAKFLDSDGNPLVGQKVKFNINGVFYERTTDKNGLAIMQINLNQGDYIITAINPINDQLYSNTVKVLPVLVAENLVLHYRDGSSFKVKALKENGSPAGGVDIKLNINGVFYDRVTKADGTASLTINLMPGSYIITTIFGKQLISNHVTVI